MISDLESGAYDLYVRWGNDQCPVSLGNFVLVEARQSPGTACDDGNSDTENDVILDDGCTCEGTLSTPVVVDGGTLRGGPFNFCVDGTPDNIPADGITLVGGDGPNRGWVVTDDQRNILGLPPTFTAPDFDAAGVGTCFVYYIAYADGLTGLVTGNNLGDLTGTFDLSNRIAVVREVCDTPIVVDGGILEGGPFNFCVDGIADNIPADGITLVGGNGPNLSLIHI